MINYTPPTQHTSLFYNSEEEYLEIILPYLKAGLENNEFCLWNLPNTLTVESATGYLRKTIEDLDSYFKKEQLSILDYKSFYFKDGAFSAARALENYVKLEARVLADSFKGVRACGDGTWAIGENWLSLMMYEKEINQVIQSHKIRAICSYHIGKLALKDICTLGANHQSSLVRQLGSWNRLDSTKFTRVNNSY